MVRKFIYFLHFGDKLCNVLVCANLGGQIMETSRDLGHVLFKDILIEEIFSA